jgi:hypothetical protein
MACCVLIASAMAVLFALRRGMGGAAVAADPRAWRLPAAKSDE